MGNKNNISANQNKEVPEQSKKKEMTEQSNNQKKEVTEQSNNQKKKVTEQPKVVETKGIVPLQSEIDRKLYNNINKKFYDDYEFYLQNYTDVFYFSTNKIYNGVLSRTGSWGNYFKNVIILLNEINSQKRKLILNHLDIYKWIFKSDSLPDFDIDYYLLLFIECRDKIKLRNDLENEVKERSNYGLIHWKATEIIKLLESEN